MVLALLLAAGSATDLRARRLPNAVTYSLAACGLVQQYLQGGIDELWLGVMGALLGFFAFWGVAELYKLGRGREGLGLGDAKLLASVGAWLGPVLLAPVVFVGAMSGLAYVGFLRLRGESLSAETIIPFGPFLSAAFFGFWCLKAAGWSPF